MKMYPMFSYCIQVAVSLNINSLSGTRLAIATDRNGHCNKTVAKSLIDSRFYIATPAHFRIK